ncbi:MAG: sialate O-acetylesterase [Chitinophagia bacterium]|nr:sialate O-acetylesterase [Chitinophagia bacterium]
MPLLKKILFTAYILFQCMPQTNAQENHRYIFLLVGQSNMAGRGKPETIDTTSLAGIWMMNRAQEWVPAREPLHFDKPAQVGVGPGYAIAREIRRKDPKAEIYLIPAAVGGSRIDLWVPDAFDPVTKLYPYNNALIRAQEAKKIGKISAIFWHQGESDSHPDRCNSYEQKLTTLIERFRSDLQQPELLFIPAQLTFFTSQRNPSKVVVNQAIKQVAEAVPGCYLVRSTRLTHKGDTLHYDSPSARMLGIRFAKAYRKLAN